jgi:hypothetical protein
LAIDLRRADDHLVLFGKRKDFGSIKPYQLWKTGKLFLLKLFESIIAMMAVNNDKSDVLNQSSGLHAVWFLHHYICNTLKEIGMGFQKCSIALRQPWKE